MPEIPHRGIPALMNAEKSTKVKPFSFDVRDSETMKKKQEKIMKVNEISKKVTIIGSLKGESPQCFLRAQNPKLS